MSKSYLIQKYLTWTFFHTNVSAIAASNVDDVRPVLEFYSQFDNPLEAFKERQLKLRVSL